MANSSNNKSTPPDGGGGGGHSLKAPPPAGPVPGDMTTASFLAASAAAAATTGSSSSIDAGGSSSSSAATASDVSAISNASGMNVPSAHSQALASIQSQLQARNLRQQHAYFSAPLQLQHLLLQQQQQQQQRQQAESRQQLSSAVSNSSTGPALPPQGTAVNNTAAKAIELAKLLSAARTLGAPQASAPAAASIPARAMTNGAAAAAAAANGSGLPQGDLAWELLQRLASHQATQFLNSDSTQRGGGRTAATAPLQQKAAESSVSFSGVNNKNKLSSNSASNAAMYCAPVSPAVVEGGMDVAVTARAGKEDGKKKSSSDHMAGTNRETVILPCRARGMDVEHNFRTAHFVVRPDIGHGEDLVCSYEACRTSGVKFRYCTSCRIPVAKRTFHQRHSHGIPTVYADAANSNRAKEEQQGGVTHQQSAVKKSASFKSSNDNTKKRASAPKHQQPVSAPPLKKRKQPFDSLKSSRSHSQINTSTHQADSMRPVANVIVQVDQCKEVSEGSGGMTDGSCNSSGFDTEERKRSWAILLERRPDSGDGDRMTAWLDEVLAVSNPKSKASSSSRRDRSSSRHRHKDGRSSSLKRKKSSRHSSDKTSSPPVKKRRESSSKKRYSSSSGLRLKDRSSSKKRYSSSKRHKSSSEHKKLPPTNSNRVEEARTSGQP